MIAYSYLRLSSKKQMAGKGRERQLENTRIASQQHGWVLSEKSFEDLGVSGWKGQNVSEGAFSEFLSLIDNGSIETPCVLICENPDRISRQGVNRSVEIMLALLRKGVQIYTVSDSRHYSGESDYALFDLMTWAISAQRGAEESDLKSQRIADAYKRKKKEARVKGTKITSQCPSWLEYDEKSDEFIVIEDRANTMRKIFELYANGYGAVQITNYLLKERIPTLGKSAKWTPQKVSYLLRQRTAIGELQPISRVNNKYIPDGEPIANYYPAIIDNKVWEAVEVIKAKNGTTRGRRATNNRNIFKGLLKCSCGRAYVLKGQKENAVRCASMGTSCKEPTWLYSNLENNVLAVLNNIDWAGVGDVGNLAEKLKELRHEIAVTETSINKASEQLRNVANAIAELGLDEGLRERSNEAKQQHKELSDKLKRLQQKEKILTADVGGEGNWKRLHEVKHLMATEEGKLQVNNYLKSIIKHITLQVTETPWVTTPNSDLPFREHDLRPKGTFTITLKSGNEIEAQVSKDQKVVYWNGGQSRMIFVKADKQK